MGCIRVCPAERLKCYHTFERIKQIAERNIMKQKDVELLATAYENSDAQNKVFMACKIEREEPDNYINLKSHPTANILLLRDALIIVNRLQMITENHFRL